MLMVIVMITGDFLAMSLTTDRVLPSKMQNSCQIGRITIPGGLLVPVCLPSPQPSWPLVNSNCISESTL
jgi:H+-transporting ATPase